MSEPRTVRSDQRRIGRELRSIRAVENGAGSYHISMEVIVNDRIAATGATHIYPQNQEELEEQWVWAKNWLKSEYPRLMPEHRPEKAKAE